MTTSLPSLGAWIETWTDSESLSLNGRSLHWERGLKLFASIGNVFERGRSLHWERGLKPQGVIEWSNGQQVAPFIGSVD